MNITAAFEPEEYDPDRKEHYRIDGPNSASWALRKLAAVREKRLAGCRLALDEMERIKAWQDHLDAELDPDLRKLGEDRS